MEKKESLIWAFVEPLMTEAINAPIPGTEKHTNQAMTR